VASFNPIDDLMHLHEPGAAGCARDLTRCKQSADGWVCSWARGRISPARLIELGRCMQGLVAGREANVTIHWGVSLQRTYQLDELTNMPIENLRRARTIEVATDTAEHGTCVKVRFDLESEPGLIATTCGPAEVAQQLKDAVDLGHWNPWSGAKIVRLTMLTVLYGVLSVTLLLTGAFLVLLAVTISSILLLVLLREFGAPLWPPVEIYEIEQTSIGSVLKRVVPILAPVVGIVTTLLAIFT
jgi:uncharacterized membrane protein